MVSELSRDYTYHLMGILLFSYVATYRVLS
jgi:hypothetical protein